MRKNVRRLTITIARSCVATNEEVPRKVDRLSKVGVLNDTWTIRVDDLMTQGVIHHMQIINVFDPDCIAKQPLIRQEFWTANLSERASAVKLVDSQ